ncbi:MAG: hypothetical protein DDT18_01830 [Actinobacteria bacterium]|nr:hypothetical protein [Actinomycetota bacterium]
MFVQRRQVEHIAPRPEPRISVVEPRPPTLLNSALHTASQLINLATIREEARREQARAAVIRAEVTAQQPPAGDLVTRRQEIPWTFILLGGGALALTLFLTKRKRK